ncbi:MAG: hypothetical protein HKN49_09400, partial [Gammaproteobacteria bacterium]|nr:hypothetical protein [Gammaproteobacteria bacterium]
MRITTGLLSAALCLVLPCQAADESYYEFASSAASAEVPAELAPLLQSEYRDDRGRYSILRRISLEIDGDRVIDRVVSITRYQTHEEAASSGNSTIYLDTSASTLSIDHALVVPPGAQPQVVDPETVQVVDDNEDLVFSDDVGIVIPWPALEPGA